jgi:hypothetical protein
VLRTPNTVKKSNLTYPSLLFSSPLHSTAGVLRTPNTINKFKAVANSNPGAQNPLLVYFSKILEDSTLNAVESIELARPVLQQVRFVGDLFLRFLRSRCHTFLFVLQKNRPRPRNSSPPPLGGAARAWDAILCLGGVE